MPTPERPNRTCNRNGQDIKSALGLDHHRAPDLPPRQVVVVEEDTEDEDEEAASQSENLANEAERVEEEAESVASRELDEIDERIKSVVEGVNIDEQFKKVNDLVKETETSLPTTRGVEEASAGEAPKSEISRNEGEKESADEEQAQVEKAKRQEEKEERQSEETAKTVETVTEKHELDEAAKTEQSPEASIEPTDENAEAVQEAAKAAEPESSSRPTAEEKDATEESAEAREKDIDAIVHEVEERAKELGQRSEEAEQSGQAKSSMHAAQQQEKEKAEHEVEHDVESIEKTREQVEERTKGEEQLSPEEDMLAAHDRLLAGERELTRKMIADESREGINVLLLLNEQLDRQERFFEAEAKRREHRHKLYREILKRVKKMEREKMQKQLQVEMQSYRAHKDLELEELRLEAEQEFNAAKRQTMVEVVRTFEKETNARMDSMKDMEAKVMALEQVFSDRNTTFKQSHLVHRLSVAILSLEEALNSKKTVREELMALKAASLEDGLVDEASKALERVAAQEGVPTVADLKTRFETVRVQGRRAALMAEGGGVFGAAVGFLLSFIPEAPEKKLPEVEGLETRFSRALFYLEREDIGGALEEMRALPEESLARRVVEDWAKEAEKRVVFEQTVKLLRAHLTCLSAALA